MMNDNQVQETINYLKALKFPESSGAYLNLALETLSPEPSFVVDNGISCFDSSVPTQLMQDVLDSLLLSSKYASQYYSLYSDLSKWYGKYKEMLRKLSWQIQDKTFTFSKRYSNDYADDNPDIFDIISTFKTDLLEYMASFTDKSELASIGKAIETIEQSQQSNSALVFEESASHSWGGMFQLGASKKKEIDGIIFDYKTIGIFYFKNTRNQIREHNQDIEVIDTEIFLAGGKMRLNQTRYTPYRQFVIQKIQSYSNQLIVPL